MVLIDFAKNGMYYCLVEDDDFQKLFGVKRGVWWHSLEIEQTINRF